MLEENKNQVHVLILVFLCLLGCDVMSFIRWVPVFQGYVVPSSSQWLVFLMYRDRKTLLLLVGRFRFGFNFIYWSVVFEGSVFTVQNECIIFSRNLRWSFCIRPFVFGGKSYISVFFCPQKWSTNKIPPAVISCHSKFSVIHSIMWVFFYLH